MRDDALVAVAACHLVADREGALGGEVDLHHLEHARGELVAALHVVELAALLGVGRLDARPELAVHDLGLLARLGRALHPLLAEVLDLLDDDLGDVARADLLAGGRVDHLGAEDAVDLGDHLLEEVDALAVHHGLVVGHVLLELLLLVVAEVHAAAEPLGTDHDALGAVLVGGDDVVAVAPEDGVGLERLVDVVERLHVGGVVEVADLEPGLDLVHAGVGEGHGAGLLIHRVVQLALQKRHHAVNDNVLLDVVAGRPADDEGRARLVDEDGVDLVHDGEVVPALHIVLDAELHVVAEVVEAELVVRAVGDVRCVRRTFCSGVVALSGEDLAVGEPEEVVDSTHPVGVTTSEVVVDGDDVHAFAGQRVQVDRAGRDKGFALARLHLGDHAAVQHHAADTLDVEVTHVEHAPARFTHHAEGFGEQVIERLTVVDALLEVGGARAQIFVGEREVLRLQLADAGDGGLEALDQAVSGGAEYLGEYNIEAEHAGILFGAGSSARSLVRTRSGGAVGESRRRCLKPGAYNCSHRPVERRRYFVSSCSGVKLSGGVGEISLFCGRIRAQ